MEEKKLHIAMMPWLAMGHLIPFMELSKRIAQQGHTISFISTPKNFSRLPKIPPNLSHLIHPIQFPLPSIEKLPQKAEASIDLSSDDLRPYLRKAYDSLKPQVSDFLHVARPDWIIIDYAPYWVPELASEYGIPCAFLSLFTCAVMAFYGPPSVLMDMKEFRSRPEDFTKVPDWIPFNTSIFYRGYEARELFSPGGIMPDDLGVSENYRFARVIEDCQVVAIRSSTDLEVNWLNLLEDLYKKPVIPIGFFTPLPDKKLSTRNYIIEWLDRQKQGEVVYVAFGSEAKLNSSQINEIALGLEMSQLPFIWALRDPNGLPQDFEARIKTQGLICKEWVPQVNILSHSSIGGFLTHGGWNSIIEGLSLEVKLILLPLIFDQGLNARDMVERGVSIEIERDESNGSFAGRDIAKNLRLIMREKEGETFGNKVKEYKKIFGDEETNEKSLRLFLKHLSDNRK
ncbi:hypothetical protein LUZ60_001722 [Juncus effusus]|nr:hypothetical protein LUZ60_001722 [Juncus effusus]